MCCIINKAELCIYKAFRKWDVVENEDTISYNVDPAETKNRLKKAMFVAGGIAALSLLIAAAAAAVFFGAPVALALAAGTFVATIALPTMITAAVVTGLTVMGLGLMADTHRKVS